MLKKVLFVIFLHFCLIINRFLLADTDNFFTAAVLEFTPPGNNYSTPKEIVDSNLNEYLVAIDDASQFGVQILVFPEATLNYHGISTREGFLEVAVELKAAIYSESSCDYSDSHILNQISLKIKEKSLYVLVNLLEKEACNKAKDIKCSNDGFKLYNTNLVFNKNGCVISRYRKFNLFLEPALNTESEAGLATFDTDFGVKFGHFVCFDIMFQSPTLDLIEKKGVQHLLYPSMWYSQIPFLTSTQLHSAWAYKNNVVLLSSGANNPSSGSTGSGIFVGKHGAIELIVAPHEMRKLIIAKVPKDINSYNPKPSNQTYIKYSQTELDHLSLLHYTPPYTRGLPSMLANDENTIEVCKSKICCQFSIKYQKLQIPSDKKGYTYRLAVFYGQRTYADDPAGELFCAIIPCINDQKDGCGKRFRDSSNFVPSIKFESIKISARTEIENDPNKYFVMPSTLDFNILPLNAFNYNFTSSETFDLKGKTYQRYTIETNINFDNLMTFGIFGRNFNLDGKPSVRDIFSLTSSKFLSNTSVWIGIFSLFAISYYFSN